MAVTTGSFCSDCGISLPIGDSSGLCHSCFANQTMNTPQSGCKICGADIPNTYSSPICQKCFDFHITNQPPPQKPLEHVCKECHHLFKIVRSKDVCDPCYRMDQDREQLHLYEVFVWDQGDGVRPTSTTVILDVDEDLAAENVLDKMGYTNVLKTEVTELVGPYTSGFIVSFSTLP